MFPSAALPLRITQETGTSSSRAQTPLPRAAGKGPPLLPSGESCPRQRIKTFSPVSSETFTCRSVTCQELIRACRGVSVEACSLFFSLGDNPLTGEAPQCASARPGPCERGRASPPSRPRPRPRHSELACPRCPLPAFCFCSLHGYSWPFAVSHEFWNLLGKRDVARKIQERRKAPPDRRSDSIRFSVGVAPLLLRTRASRHSPGGGAWGSHVHPHFTGEDLEPEGESLT